MSAVYTPQPQSLYGRAIAASDVEQALREHVEEWVVPYLHEVERQHALPVGTIEQPHAIAGAHGERFVEEALPAIEIVNTTTADLPEPDGQGRYMARWAVTLRIHVSASDGARELAMLYGLALRMLAVQQVPPLYMGVDWTGEEYLPPALVGGRSYYTAEVQLECHVPDVTNRHAGPTEPGWPDGEGEPDSPAWPVAQTHAEQIVKVPIEEETQDG